MKIFKVNSSVLKCVIFQSKNMLNTSTKMVLLTVNKLKVKFYQNIKIVSFYSWFFFSFILLISFKITGNMGEEGSSGWCDDNDEDDEWMKTDDEFF